MVVEEALTPAAVTAPWAVGNPATWLGQLCGAIGRLAASAAGEDAPLTQEAIAWMSRIDIENPVRQFQLLYCLWLAVALSSTLGRQVRFLDWFDNSGCAQPAH